MSVDVVSALRRRKPERKRSRLSLREAVDLKSVQEAAFLGRPIFVPDTDVYILDAAGRLPTEAARLLDRGMSYHCPVCLAELTTGIANLDSSSSTYAVVRNHYVELLASLPSTRILTPDESVVVDAGLISGTLGPHAEFPGVSTQGMLERHAYLPHRGTRGASCFDPEPGRVRPNSATRARRAVRHLLSPHLALRPIPRYRRALVANPTPLEALGANSQN